MKGVIIIKQFSTVAFINEDHTLDIHSFNAKSIKEDNRLYSIYAEGELYNEEEVCTKLKSYGYSNPESIEEIILFSYLTWKEKAMQYLEGAYFFVIHTDDFLFCAKDPLGLRPLYYHKQENRICISNSIDQLLKIAKQKPILSREGILELFAFGPGCSEHKTLYKNILSLPMGSYLRIDHQGVKTETYYELKAHPHTDDLSTTIQTIHDLVTDSIHQQTKNCEASFLSGGLDSSIITSIASKKQSLWRTYSLDYEGNEENFKSNSYQVSLDHTYISEMLLHSNTQHTSLQITQKELITLLDDALIARQVPGMADIDSSLLWLCQNVAKQDKVILSGECADEFFGGYPWFYQEHLRDIESFPWLKSTKERISLLHDSYKSLPFEEYISQSYQNTISKIESLPEDTKEDINARKHTILCIHWFMQTLVARQVYMGNAAGVNIRAPFANVKLLEYVYNIPWKMKFLNQEEKGILREAFASELPESIAHRKKNPFPKTHNPQYAELISQLLEERYDDPDSPLHILFDDCKLKELISSKGDSFKLPWYGQLMSGPQLLAYLYQIDQWIIRYDIEIEK